MEAGTEVGGAEAKMTTSSGMVNQAEMEMHQKWNVSFKKQEAKDREGEGEMLDERRQKHLAKLEEEEIRRIAQEALKKQEERERLEQEEKASTSTAAEIVLDDRTKYIHQLLEASKSKIPDNVKTAFTSELVQLDFSYTSFVQATVKITFPQTFSPQVRLVHLDVTSKTIHEDIINKLHSGLEKSLKSTFGGSLREKGDEKGGSENGSDESDESGANSNPITHVFQFCDKFLNKNHLLPAYEEIQRLKAEVLTKPSELLGLDNKEGAIKVRLQVEKYCLSLKVKVFCKDSVDYPDGKMELSLLKDKTNLPSALQKSFLSLTEARIKLHGDTSDADEAEKKKDLALPGDGPPPKEVKSKMKKKVHPRRMNFQTHHSAVRERQIQEQQMERERERILKLREEALKPKVVEPRIFIAVKFMHDLVKEAVECKCPGCNKGVLPSNPELCSKVPAKMKPDRLYCGHFYHHHCLETYMSKPPFDDTCQVCGTQIMHHEFNETRAQLEKRWAQKQAREREIADLEDLFGF